MTQKLRILRSLPMLFIILVSLTMTLFSEKMLISNRHIRGFMPNLHNKSQMVSMPQVLANKHLHGFFPHILTDTRIVKHRLVKEKKRQAKIPSRNSSLSKTSQGSFNNYVDIILPLFDHPLPTSLWTFFTLIVDQNGPFMDHLSTHLILSTYVVTGQLIVDCRVTSLEQLSVAEFSE